MTHILSIAADETHSIGADETETYETVTIDGSGVLTIDGSGTLVLEPGHEHTTPTATPTPTTGVTPSEPDRRFGPGFPLKSHVWLGGFASLTTIGSLFNLDRKTRMLLLVLASILWGAFALAAFDIVYISTASKTVSDSVPPLVYLGASMAAATALLALYHVTRTAADEVR